MRGIADHVERFVILPSRINKDRTREVFGELRDCELAGSFIFTDENCTCAVNGINREGFTARGGQRAIALNGNRACERAALGIVSAAKKQRGIRFTVTPTLSVPEVFRSSEPTPSPVRVSVLPPSIST